MGEKGEGSGGKGGGNWEWGTPCPPPQINLFLRKTFKKLLLKNKSARRNSLQKYTV